MQLILCSRVEPGSRGRSNGRVGAGGKTPSSSNTYSLVDTLIFIGSEMPNFCSPLQWEVYCDGPATSRPLFCRDCAQPLVAESLWESGWERGKEERRGGEEERERDLAQSLPDTWSGGGPWHPQTRPLTCRPKCPGTQLRTSPILGPHSRIPC